MNCVNKALVIETENKYTMPEIQNYYMLLTRFKKVIKY